MDPQPVRRRRQGVKTPEEQEKKVLWYRKPWVWIAGGAGGVILVLLLVLLIDFDESVPPVTESPTGAKLQQIGEAYRAHLDEKKKPPSGAEDLKPFLSRHGDPQDILVSDRDGMPFQIVWGVNLYEEVPALAGGGGGKGGGEGRAFRVLAAEQLGADQSRLFLRVDGSVDLAYGDDAQRLPMIDKK